MLTQLDVLIVGSGFSGLAQGVLLDRAGIKNWLILEKGNDVGGTWRENTYPGAACDIPSHLYSFSFEPNPTWTRSYSPQEEILNYLRRVADKYDLRGRIRFDTEVVKATWSASHWTIQTKGGETLRARALVLGVGGLHIPALPNIEGLDAFEGARFHSAQWNHDVDLSGKRVAVIGTGASSIQFVPRIAPKVSKLDLFQRTPPWVMPKPDYPIGERARSLYTSIPFTQKLVRTALYWNQEWKAAPLLGNAPRLAKAAAWVGRRHLEKSIPDPVLREKLTPRYQMGCKRILLSNDYYPALLRPNVEVITDAIDRVEKNGVRTKDGVLHQSDALILGTGFKVAEYLSSIRVEGTRGELNDTWKKETATYLGITVSGFPNMFLLMGPNTGLGHNSMIFMIEAQARYATRCIAALRDFQSMDVKPEMQQAFTRELAERTEGTVWKSGCKSWYQGDDGRNLAIWPGYTVEYWQRTRKVDLDAYAISRSSGISSAISFEART